MFEFEGEVYWRAKSTKEGDDRSKCKGKLKFYEFNQTDDELSVEITCGSESNFADGVKRTVRTKVAEKMLDEALKLVPAMKEKDIDEEKIASAKAQEKAAEQGFKDATENKGEIKLQIFNEAKKKEEEMKKIEAKKNVPMKASAQAAAAAPVGQGSVWNTNSYHWEEKSVNFWAEETLKKIISNFKFSMETIRLNVVEIVKLQGEAGSCVRRGKKIITFDYEINFKWKCTMDGLTGCSCSGEYTIPSFSHEDDAEDWEIRTDITLDEGGFEMLAAAVIKELATKELRKELKEKFVDELKKK